MYQPVERGGARSWNGDLIEDLSLRASYNWRVGESQPIGGAEVGALLKGKSPAKPIRGPGKNKRIGAG